MFNTQIIYEQLLDSLVTKKMVIFGTSIAAQQAIHRYLINEMDHINYFCDNDSKKWGTNFMGKEVCSPERLLKDKDDIVILIASMHSMEIMDQLKQMGFKDNVYVSEILTYKARHSKYLQYNGYKFIVPDYSAYSYTNGSPYKNSIIKINNNINKIQKVLNSLSDDKSKFVYEYIIHNRKYNYFNYSNIMELGFNMYFVDGIFEFSDDEIFIDGGSYDGQTSLMFIKATKNNYNMIYAFEPDAKSFICCQNMLKQKIEEGKLKLVEKGLYSENSTVSFNASGDTRSGISSVGNSIINTTKLDDEVAGKITFLKLDIEGTEIEALLGAKEKITTYKPKLAVSLYHNIEHLWEIPLLVKSMVPEYKLYIRHHSQNLEETVLYATI